MLVIVVVIVVVLFEIWFFFFSASPIDQRTGRAHDAPLIGAQPSGNEGDAGDKECRRRRSGRARMPRGR